MLKRLREIKSNLSEPPTYIILIREVLSLEVLPGWFITTLCQMCMLLFRVPAFKSHSIRIFQGKDLAEPKKLNKEAS